MHFVRGLFSSFIFSLVLSYLVICCSGELNPKTVELNSLRLQEWETQKNIYESLFIDKTYLPYYSTNTVTLNPKRCGIRGTSAIINDNHKLIMCTIPKVGSSTWRKFMLYLDFPELSSEQGRQQYARKYGVAAPDQHNISKNGVKLMALQTPSRALEYYNDASYLRVFHVRNPITRLLSAWLSKNAESSNPLPFAMHFPTFAAFVEDLVSSKLDLSKADGHIRFQRTFCDFDRGAHYDIFLKFENRKHWGTHLLRHLRKEADPVFQQFVRASQIPFMGADTLEVILKHYTPSVFDMVSELYRDDIEAFGYRQDVKVLGDIIRSATHRSSPP